MWIFCKKEVSGSYSIGFIQGTDGIWCEIFTVDSMREAMRTVNYLNGGNGFPLDLRPPKLDPGT